MKHHKKGYKPNFDQRAKLVERLYKMQALDARLHHDRVFVQALIKKDYWTRWDLNELATVKDMSYETTNK